MERWWAAPAWIRLSVREDREVLERGSAPILGSDSLGASPIPLPLLYLCASTFLLGTRDASASGRVCGSGEIGRHTILRGWRRKAWGFKSPLPHHTSRQVASNV